MTSKIIRLTLAGILALLCVDAIAADKFTVQATYTDGVLNSLNFDYSPVAVQTPPGFTANGKHIAGSACYAKVSGEDNDTITGYLAELKDKQTLAAITDSRNRMKEAVARKKLELWQEVLCVATGSNPVPYRETGPDAKGKWDSALISIDGVRKGSWSDVFTVVRRTHLYSVTVTPAPQSAPE